MQNNVSGNTLLASLTTPSKNTGRDAASARKDTQESGVNFREAMDQMTRLKVDARRDQLAARAKEQANRSEGSRVDKQESRVSKLEERRTDQQPKKVAASDNTAAAAQKTSNAQCSDRPASEPLQKKSSTDASESNTTITDAANDPAADSASQMATATTEEAQVINPNTDLASALDIEPLEPAVDTLAIGDPEAESALLGEVDDEAIAPLLAEMGLINVNGINLPPADTGLAGFAKASGLLASESLKDGMSGGFLFSGDSNGNGKAGVANMAGSLLNSMELTEDGLSLEGDLVLEESGTSFTKLLTASREAQALLDPAKPPLAALVSPGEAAPRLVETAALNRSFVVQTGMPTAMGQPGWNQAVGEKVLWLAAQNLSSAEIRLDPPELGPMQVRITIQNDQANVSFSSPHLVVREALDQSATRLREMFAEQGLNLADVNVSDQSFARQQARDESNPRSGRDGHDPHELENETLVGTTDISAIRLVDHYA